MEQYLRSFKGIWIPKEIWLNNELSLFEKVLLVEIDSLDNNEWCYASNEYFSKFFWKSERQIRNYLSQLKEKWWIKEVWFNWRKRILKSCIKEKIAKL